MTLFRRRPSPLPTYKVGLSSALLNAYRPSAKPQWRLAMNEAWRNALLAVWVLAVVALVAGGFAFFIGTTALISIAIEGMGLSPAQTQAADLAQLAIRAGAWQVWGVLGGVVGAVGVFVVRAADPDREIVFRG